MCYPEEAGVDDQLLEKLTKRMKWTTTGQIRNPVVQPVAKFCVFHTLNTSKRRLLYKIIIFIYKSSTLLVQPKYPPNALF
jgi:hypothetical protein